jgi:hypothetical protein
MLSQKITVSRYSASCFEKLSIGAGNRVEPSEPIKFWGKN